MKKRIICNFLMLTSLFFSGFTAQAQQVNTTYFMENVPVRNKLNPAFQPISNFYLGFPVLGYTQIGVGNNTISIKDLIYKQNGQTVSVFESGANKDILYNALNANTLFGSNAELNILDFGFRKNDNYWSFSITEKIDGNVNLPKDLMKFLLYGAPNIDNNVFDFRNLNVDITAYTEAALGFSRNINDKWSFGAKFKFLYGNLNATSSNQNIDLQLGIDKWSLIGNGNINYSGPIDVQGTNLKNLNFTYPATTMGWAKPSGLGGGIDLGLTYKPIESLSFSAAITDLGMIRWNQNINNLIYEANFSFDGIGKLTNYKNNSALIDSILTTIGDSISMSYSNTSYNTYTKAKLNMGAELRFFDNTLSLGLLSRTLLYKKNLYEELTASINARPADWFNLSASYSIMNGRMSNIGAGLGLRTGFIHWFASADYVPLNYAPLPINSVNYPVPYNTAGLNLAIGVNFVFGNGKDADKDGVQNRWDKCPETAKGVMVDKKGCPIDTDGDGVPDYLDMCSNTPLEAYNKINAKGCPIDTDQDGVPDYMDKCPKTPISMRDFVNDDGCTTDSDGDGVSDTLDKCPNTPAIVKGLVTADGCPKDTDKDGVYDYLDKCANTPANAKVDSIGCPFDSDKDGVVDYLDKCPDTPAEYRRQVDKNGCHKVKTMIGDFDGEGKTKATKTNAIGEIKTKATADDSDSDGVADALDKCPKTPAEARGKVDEKGCPLDTDGDGVYDYLDKCPKVSGVASNGGCPELKTDDKRLFQKALQGIQFEAGSAAIRPVSLNILNQVAGVLIANSTYLVEIRGHTDNAGTPETNLILSQKRAESVKRFLISKGISADRLTTSGFGGTVPLSDNNTAAGKAKNRRVEFIVSYNEISF